MSRKLWAFQLLRNVAIPIIQNQDTSYIYKPILSALISSKFREKCAKIVADLKNELFQYFPKSNGQFPLAQTISNGEIYDFGQLLTANQIDEIHEYLKDQPLANVHYYDYGNRSYSFNELLQTNSHYGSYSRDVTLNCPHILSVLFADDIVDSITAYLGTVPTISSINLFWTFNQDSLGKVSQFHRDMDDIAFINLLIYLIDMNDIEDGPHQYIKNSANFDYVSGKIQSINVNLDSNIFFDHLWPKSTIEKVFDEEIQEVLGPAGTVFCSNSYCLHRGVPPKFKPRLVLSVIYSVLALKDDSAYTKFELPQHINLNQRNKIMSNFLFKVEPDAIG